MVVCEHIAFGGQLGGNCCTKSGANIQFWCGLCSENDDATPSSNACVEVALRNLQAAVTVLLCSVACKAQCRQQEKVKGQGVIRQWSNTLGCGASVATRRCPHVDTQQPPAAHCCDHIWICWQQCPSWSWMIIRYGPPTSQQQYRQCRYHIGGLRQLHCDSRLRNGAAGAANDPWLGCSVKRCNDGCS